jgi:hypothetical protein
LILAATDSDREAARRRAVVLAGFALAVWWAAASCNGPAAPLPVAASAPAEEFRAKRPPGHGDELLVGLPATGPAPRPPAGSELDTDRPGLLEAGWLALEERRLDEALSIAEVLLLVHGAHDPEARELRGRCLEALDDGDPAREDLAACCAAGRHSCCAPGAR